MYKKVLKYFLYYKAKRIPKCFYNNTISSTKEITVERKNKVLQKLRKTTK